MNGLYLYAVVDEVGLGLPRLRGVGDSALTGLPVGDLLAVVSPALPGLMQLNRENLLRHEAVVEALMEGRSVLPAYFGTTLLEGDLTRALAGQADALAQSLERVRGRVELSLRVLNPKYQTRPLGRPARPAAGDGRSYLLALLDAEYTQVRLREATDEATAYILAALAPLAEAAVYSGPSGRQVLKVAYLVRRGGVENLRRAIEAQRVAHPGLAFLATGPWPTYSFTALNQSLGLGRAEGGRR